MSNICNELKEYELLGVLGRGATAEVYLAKWKKTALDVAVKKIFKSKKNPGITKQVENEIRILKDLDHKSILKLYHSFEDDKHHYLVLELCAKGDLMSYMQKRNKVFLEEEARNIMIQICEAFYYLKTKKIMHRDVKLANILITEEGNIKIADFGLSADSEENHRTMCGTPNTMSPEVATGNCHSKEADIFSLGCVLYYLLIGRYPFEGEDCGDTTNNIITRPADISDILSYEAQNLIGRMLEKDPSKRISLEGVMEHAFLGRMPQTYSKGYLHASVDSGLSSLASSAYSSRSSGRQALSKWAVASEFPVSNYHYSREDLPRRSEARLGNQYPRQGRAQFPAFGKSPPVRDAGSQSNVMKSLKKTLTVLPPNFVVSPRNKLRNSHNRPIPVNHDVHGKDLTEEQQPLKPAHGDGCLCNHCSGRDRGEECENQNARGCNSLRKTRHVCALDKKPCCSQCTDSHSCEREHCPRLKSTCCSDRCRSPSPSRCCNSGRSDSNSCHHSQHSSSCSHQGSCNLSVCQHSEVCCCRKSTVHPCSTSVENRVTKSKQKVVATTGSLRDLTAPINTKRLNPIRQVLKNAAVSIQSNGEVVLQLLKSHNNRAEVVEICLISSDGMDVLLYRPTNTMFFNADATSPIPESGEKHNSVRAYTFAKLSQKHWKKYLYAARFVSLVQAKTPKITLYSPEGKCILMEKDDNVEVTFNNGGRVSMSDNSVKIVDVNGKTFETSDELNNENPKGLNSSMKEIWESAVKLRNHCYQLAERLESLENELGVSFLPAYVGRQLASTVSKSASSHKSATSPMSSNLYLSKISNMPSYDATVGSSNFSGGNSSIRTFDSQKENVQPLRSIQPNGQATRGRPMRNFDERFRI